MSNKSSLQKRVNCFAKGGEGQFGERKQCLCSHHHNTALVKNIPVLVMQITKVSIQIKIGDNFFTHG